jgi:hypothetical protein
MHPHANTGIMLVAGRTLTPILVEEAAAAEAVVEEETEEGVVAEAGAEEVAQEVAMMTRVVVEAIMKIMATVLRRAIMTKLWRETTITVMAMLKIRVKTLSMATMMGTQARIPM